jgi:hypothetical protein
MVAMDHGSRIVQLRFADKNGDGDLEMEVETWLRMEGGDMVTRVLLNETYGRNRYRGWGGGS